MKKALLVPLIAGICLLTGCAEAPDQVKENMKDYGVNEQIVLDNVTYCSPAELKNITPDTLTYQPKNLILPDKIDFSDVEDVGLVTFCSKENFSVNKEDFAAQIGVVSPKWTKGDTAEAGWDFQTDDTFGYVLENGRFAFFSGKYEKYVDDENYLEITNRIYLGRESCPDITCNLNGTSTSLQQVIDSADEWIDEFPYLDGELTYKIRTAYIRHDNAGNDYVELFYQPMYKGVGLSYITHLMDPNVMGSIVIVAMSSGLSVNIETPGTISTCVTQLNPDVVKEEMADKVIDFDSALKLAEEKLSGFNRLKVVEVRIEYVLKPIYNPDKQSPYGEHITMEARPVYTFYIPCEHEENNYEYGITEANGLVYVNVDMLDGTVTDNFSVNSFHGN